MNALYASVPGAKNTTMWSGKRFLGFTARAVYRRRAEGGGPEARPPSSCTRFCSFLLRRVPALEPALHHLTGFLGRQGAVEHLRRRVPQIVLVVGRAPREDLVGAADGRLALVAPVQEGLRQRVLEGHVVVREREEARQRGGGG